MDDMPIIPRDAGADVRAYFDARTRQYLKHVINDEVIAEHRRNPHAQHRSEPLGRLLFYFKNLPIEKQYALRRTTSSTFRITTIPRPGHAPVEVDPTDFPDQLAGFHGIFLRKIKDLMENNDG
ncbi:hypothetical protein [Pontibaca methylaminivorans]|uniref:N,N-dimethylformamidase alpha subunit domain-containing protein n=1 Tax=Pontibaca methylaminivorans TaxID=515897 RepID=A0A1R3WQG5_9RHOB|nr:hypothetical protein [Pontibaca methylaminivorans]SIT80130.1 hypothetical protein SAMN05421849_1258 [Pontibaca methylaminivorans]